MEKRGVVTGEARETRETRSKVAREQSPLDKMPAPRAGDFREARRADTKAVPNQQVKVSAAEAEGADSVSAAEARARALAQVCEDLDLTREKIEDIIDALFMTGEYRETVPITKRLAVTFRTRTADEERRLREALRDIPESNTIERDYYITMYNLSTSLVQYGEGDEFEDAGRTRDYLRNLPTVIVNKLSAKLHEFEWRVAVAMEDEHLRDF